LRLTSKEINIIKNQVYKTFEDAKIYLFGSRIDDSLNGGDIDLYIITKTPSFAKKLRLKTILEDLLFKPVDIVLAKDKNRLIEKEALKGVKIG